MRSNSKVLLSSWFINMLTKKERISLDSSLLCNCSFQLLTVRFSVITLFPDDFHFMWGSLKCLRIIISGRGSPRLSMQDSAFIMCSIISFGLAFGGLQISAIIS